MSWTSQNVPSDYIEPEWTQSSIRYACRCASRVRVDPISESWFLIHLAEITGRTLDDMADETEMKRDSYVWLHSMCGNDYAARAGLRHVRRVRSKVASHIRAEAARRKASDGTT